MFKLAVFLFVIIAWNHSHSSGAIIGEPIEVEPELQGPSMQCSKFLLTVLQPFLANLDAQQDSFGGVSFNETMEKLDKLDKQQANMKSQLVAILEALSRDKNIAPANFERIRSRYFYIERNATLNWVTAATACGKMGGYLAAFKDQEELTSLSAKLKNGTHYWLGINDRNKEGTYVSLATGTAVYFSKWAAQEPRTYYGDEDCTVIYEGSMYQQNCDKNFHNYICMADNQP